MAPTDRGDGRLTGSALLTGGALRARAERALAVPLARALGAALLDETDPVAGVVCPGGGGLRDNGAGGTHSAALAALLELAGYLALLPQLSETEHAVTHAVAMQLLAPAGSGDRIEVRGVADRRTGRLGFVSVAAQVGTATVARAQLTKSIVRLA